jgi:hypothetical protein
MKRKKSYKRLLKFTKNNIRFKTYVLLLDETNQKIGINPDEEEINRDLIKFTAIVRTGFDIFGVDLTNFNDLIKDLRKKRGSK